MNLGSPSKPGWLRVLLTCMMNSRALPEASADPKICFMLDTYIRTCIHVLCNAVRNPLHSTSTVWGAMLGLVEGLSQRWAVQLAVPTVPKMVPGMISESFWVLWALLGRLGSSSATACLLTKIMICIVRIVARATTIENSALTPIPHEWIHTFRVLVPTSDGVSMWWTCASGITRLTFDGLRKRLLHSERFATAATASWVSN